MFSLLVIFSLWYSLLCSGILIYRLIFSRRGERGRDRTKESYRKKRELQREREIQIKVKTEMIETKIEMIKIE